MVPRHGEGVEAAGRVACGSPRGSCCCGAPRSASPGASRRKQVVPAVCSRARMARSAGVCLGEAGGSAGTEYCFRPQPQAPGRRRRSSVVPADDSRNCYEADFCDTTRSSNFHQPAPFQVEKGGLYQPQHSCVQSGRSQRRRRHCGEVLKPCSWDTLAILSQGANGIRRWNLAKCPCGRCFPRAGAAGTDRDGGLRVCPTAISFAPGAGPRARTAGTACTADSVRFHRIPGPSPVAGD